MLVSSSPTCVWGECYSMFSLDLLLFYWFWLVILGYHLFITTVLCITTIFCEIFTYPEILRNSIFALTTIFTCNEKFTLLFISLQNGLGSSAAGHIPKCLKDSIFTGNDIKKQKCVRAYGCGTLCQAVTLGWHCSSSPSCPSTSMYFSNPLIMASIATLRDFLLPLLACCGDDAAGWDPPSPVAEPIKASTFCSAPPLLSCSANCIQASSSLSSTCAGAVARPKKNPFSSSAIFFSLIINHHQHKIFYFVNKLQPIWFCK